MHDYLLIRARGHETRNTKATKLLRPSLSRVTRFTLGLGAKRKACVVGLGTIADALTGAEAIDHVAIG